MTAPADIAIAEDAYRRGDFRAARAAAKAIAAAADARPEDKQRAAEILAATGVDPAAVVAFAITAALLAFLIAHYVF